MAIILQSRMANAQREGELSEIISSIKEPKRVLSLDHGGESSALRNEALLRYLQEIEEYSRRDLTPGGIEAAEREKDGVIKDFSLVVDEWMREVNKKKQQSGIAKVVLYGSKASKTSLKSDDIDMLIVAPTYVDRYIPSHVGRTIFSETSSICCKNMKWHHALLLSLEPSSLSSSATSKTTAWTSVSSQSTSTSSSST